MGRIEIAVREPQSDRNAPHGETIWRRVIPGFIISTLLLAALLTFADLSQFWRALRMADHALIALVAVVSVLWLAIRAIFWRKLLRDRVGFADVFFALNEGYLLNNTLPLRLGELGRAYLLSRRNALTFWEILASIAIERVLDLAFAVLLLLSTLPFLVGLEFPFQTVIGLGLVGAAGLGTLYLMAKRRAWLAAQYQKLAERFPGKLAGASRAILTLMDGLSILTEGRLFLLALFWALLDWAVAVGQYYLLVRAFFPEGTLLWAAFALSVAALGIAAPSSPGAVGVFEAAVVGALVVFDADPGSALALALVAHLIQVVVTGAFGAYALAREGDSLIGLYRQLRHVWANIKPPKDSFTNE